MKTGSTNWQLKPERNPREGQELMVHGIKSRNDNDNTALERLRKRVLGGAYILLDTLTEDELVAMQTMLFNNEAEIVNSACKPFLVAKLDKTIIAP